MRLTAQLLAVLTLTGVAASQESVSYRPLALEAAFDARTITADSVVSHDGRWLAYVVDAPSEKNGGDLRWLPNGAPGDVVGKSVFLTETTSRKSLSIAPRISHSWRPVFSPDSSKLAFYCDADGATHLWVYDVRLGKAHQVSGIVVKAQLFKGDEPTWSPDSRTIYIPAVPEKAMEPALQQRSSPERTVPSSVSVEFSGQEAMRQPTAPQAPKSDADKAARLAEALRHWLPEANASLAAVSLVNGAVKTLVPAATQPYPSMLQLSPSGKWMSYVGVVRSELAVVPVDGGPVRQIASERDISRGAGFAALSALAWHPLRDQLFWVQHHEVWTLDLSMRAEAPHRIASELADVTLEHIAFTQDGQNLIVGTRPAFINDFRDPAPQAIAVVPLQGGAPRVFSLPSGLHITQTILSAKSVLWQPAADSASFICEGTKTGETTVVRVNLTSGETSILWKGSGALNIVGTPSDRSTLVAKYEDVRTPGNLYAFSDLFARTQRFTEVEPRLTQSDVIGAVDTFETTVPLFDGSLSRVLTTVYLPPGAKRGSRLPTIICLYPGQNLAGARATAFGGVTETIFPASIFTSRGYAVLLTDTPLSPYDPHAQKDTPGNPAQDLTDVVVAQAYRAQELGYTDLSRTVLLGASAGGYGVAAVISRTNLFRAAVAESGFYDLAGSFPTQRNTVIHRRMAATPWENLQRYLENSPYAEADHIHTPLLLLHGGGTFEIPIEEPRKLFTALRELGRTAQLAIYTTEGHSGWSVVDSVDASKRVLEFLDRYLGLIRDADGHVQPAKLQLEPAKQAH